MWRPWSCGRLSNVSMWPARTATTWDRFGCRYECSAAGGVPQGHLFVSHALGVAGLHLVMSCHRFLPWRLNSGVHWQLAARCGLDVSAVRVDAELPWSHSLRLFACPTQCIASQHVSGVKDGATVTLEHNAVKCNTLGFVRATHTGACFQDSTTMCESCGPTKGTACTAYIAALWLLFARLCFVAICGICGALSQWLVNSH
mgnify:CR=1 FL=1